MSNYELIQTKFCEVLPIFAIFSSFDPFICHSNHTMGENGFSLVDLNHNDWLSMVVDLFMEKYSENAETSVFGLFLFICSFLVAFGDMRCMEIWKMEENMSILVIFCPE